MVSLELGRGVRFPTVLKHARLAVSLREVFDAPANRGIITTGYANGWCSRQVGIGSEEMELILCCLVDCSPIPAPQHQVPQTAPQCTSSISHASGLSLHSVALWRSVYLSSNHHEVSRKSSMSTSIMLVANTR